MTPILIHSNHFLTSPDNLGSINDQPLTLQSPGVDFQNNEFNITPPAKLKVPVYVTPDPVEDIGDVLRFHWKDSNTGSKNIGYICVYFDYSDGSLAATTMLIPKSLKKKWVRKDLDGAFDKLSLINSYLNNLIKIRIQVYLMDTAYQFQYGFHISLANLHYRNVLTDFADKEFGNWKVSQSAVAPGFDPAGYGIKQFDGYGSQPYSLWIEWGIGKKYEVGSWVEVSTEI
jgi:hypothetical protein